MNEIMTFVQKWIELEIITLSKVGRFRTIKFIGSFSYLEYRAKRITNTHIYIHIHTYIQNMTVIEELSRGTRGARRGKEMMGEIVQKYVGSMYKFGTGELTESCEE
jgi:hypothetical protein